MPTQPRGEVGGLETRQREPRQEQRADPHAQRRERRDAEFGDADPDEQERRAPQGGEYGQQKGVLGRHRGWRARGRDALNLTPRYHAVVSRSDETTRNGKSARCAAANRPDGRLGGSVMAMAAASAETEVQRQRGAPIAAPCRRIRGGRIVV